MAPVPRTIVVGVHGCDDAAIDAVALAGDLSSPQDVVVLTAVHRPIVGPESAPYHGALRSAIGRDLDALAGMVPADRSVEIDVRAGRSITAGLHAAAEDHAADLLLVGPPHAGAPVFAYRQALRAMHDAPCAVAVAPAGQRDRRPLGEVTVAWGRTPESEIALETAVAEAARRSAFLRIVHAVDPDQPYSGHTWSTGEPAPLLMDDLLEQGRANLARAERAVGGRVPVVLDLRTGDVAQQIAGAAADADVLVVGSRGYGTLGRMLLGSTGAGALRLASCPVLVPPRPAQPPLRGPTIALAETCV